MILRQLLGEFSVAIHHSGSLGPGGLIQTLPGTARRFGVSNRFDSAANIAGGIKYLAFLLKRFQGDRIRATAAYFTGEARIEHRAVTDFAPDLLAYGKKVYFHLTEETLKNSREVLATKLLQQMKLKPNPKHSKFPLGSRDIFLLSTPKLEVGFVALSLLQH